MTSTDADHASTVEPSPPLAEAAASLLCLLGMVVGWWYTGDESTAGVAVRFVAFVTAYLAGGLFPSLDALDSIRRGRPNVDVLTLAAALGSLFIQNYTEGAVLLFLFSFSETLEEYAEYRSTRSIAALMKLRPKVAARIVDGVETTTPIEDLRVDDVVRLRPGERVAVDGVVVDGKTYCDESTLTGESAPVEKQLGDPVFAGTLNGDGGVLVRMTHAAADTTLERIVRMVQEAQAQKTPTQRFVESWQTPYVIAVFVASGATFAGGLLVHTKDVADAAYHAMVLLVAASPCAVVAASPAVLLSAIARAARRGVLFKGGVYLETLATIDVVAFDKTGTLTFGKPALTDVWTPPGDDADALLALAAAVEEPSEHPLARTVVAAARDRGIAFQPAVDFETRTGLGVAGRVGKRWVGVGREGLFAGRGFTLPDDARVAADALRDEGKTALIVYSPAGADGPELRGAIAVADIARPNAAAAVAALRRLGVPQIVLLSGDHPRVANAVGKAVGVDVVHAGLLPDQKVMVLKALQRKAAHGSAAMVGDGVNDAPALSTAAVGVAMGRRGSDVALESADVVLMRDDLATLPWAVWLSRQALAQVRQNMMFAFGVIALLLAGTYIDMPLWVGVLAHEGSTLVVVLNGLRIFLVQPPDFVRADRTEADG
ncbi:MAG: heavy metal translocating P-type ATPase [Planctomycetia bacterium]